MHPQMAGTDRLVCAHTWHGLAGLLAQPPLRGQHREQQQGLVQEEAAVTHAVPAAGGGGSRSERRSGRGGASAACCSRRWQFAVQFVAVPPRQTRQGNGSSPAQPCHVSTHRRHRRRQAGGVDADTHRRQSTHCHANVLLRKCSAGVGCTLLCSLTTTPITPPM